MTSEPHPSLFAAVRRWWSERAAQEGPVAATRSLLIGMWEFVRDSTPARLRQRYGDADYDWDYRVNTTSGAVGWRDRLLGVFHSPYQPTEPALFRKMIEALREAENFDPRQFTFLDLGSGKGRTLLMASDYPFERIIGVELLPSLHAVAKENLAAYHNESQRCFEIESVCADATSWSLPATPLLIYLFNPFPEAGLRRVIANIEQSAISSRCALYVLYHNPLLEHVLAGRSSWRKVSGTHQYSIFVFGENTGISGGNVPA
ncbi:MAG TPA: class I SAM-dependent methyltransferase [Verrucomicrobiae bacterium]|jgi:SAM-dependent methyltransferase|nr:class I SAM-dependent methyltransferase [Verrucomicrobiae bacterium]